MMSNIIVFLSFLIYNSNSASLKPVFYLPCLTCSPLFANITEPDKYPQCPKPFINRQFWPINYTLQKEYPDCYGVLIDSQFNETTNKVSPLPGISIFSTKFGDYESQSGFIPLANKLIKEEGYEKNKNLFGCCYDWIHYYLGLDYFFKEFTEKIEWAVNNNEGKKAVLIGLSLGTHFVHYFLTNLTTPEWREKYIDRVVMAGTCPFGCFDPFTEFVQGFFSRLTTTERVKQAAYKMPSCQLLSSNYIVSKNSIIFQNAKIDDNLNIPKKDNRSSIERPKISQFKNADIKAPEIRDYLINYGHLKGEALQIFNVIEKGLQSKPIELDVPLLVLYNSGIDTFSYYDASNGYDNLVKKTGKGDGTCQSESAEYICDNWNHVKCFDPKSKDMTYAHIQMLKAPDNMERIIDFIDNPA
ncbi:hypothetical protein M9Y10_000806 [Tritrichomonas musculus]|uniref:Lecithin:cholesterol acyltransferase family protein n=1 Tax=Tritrichomonas musculus TaxID=1915356 RepID=A0ABR2L570_9EUKA